MSAPAYALQRRPSGSVLELFQAFWKELVSMRQAVLTQSQTTATAAIEPALLPVSSGTRDRMRELLRKQEMHATAVPRGSVTENYREAQYLMASLADEVFIRLSWSGAEAWKAHLLETELFQSRCAGDAVFTRIERLLERQDPADRELAAVYLSALALGFRGRYLDRDDKGAIPQLRRRLGEFILERGPRLGSPGGYLIPACYESTVDAGKGPKLRDGRVWALAIALVVVAWLVISSFVWQRLSGDVVEKASQIVGRQVRLR